MASRSLFSLPFRHNMQGGNVSSSISTKPWYTVVLRFVYCYVRFGVLVLNIAVQSIAQADYVVPVEIEYHWHNVYVIKRPGVDNFLKEMGKIYEIVVFTASLSKVCYL